MDVGVAACYQLGGGGGAGSGDGPGGESPPAPALDVVAGYHAVEPLSCADMNLVAEFLVAPGRGADQAHAARDPANADPLRRPPRSHFAALRAIGIRIPPPPASWRWRRDGACTGGGSGSGDG